MAGQLPIPAWSDSAILVTCDGADIMCVGTHPYLDGRRSAVVERGVVEVMPNEPVLVRVSNYAEQKTHLP